MSEKWEYRIVEGGQGLTGENIRKKSETILNNFGLQGWECYHVKSDTYPSVFYMKRLR